jgi:Domain of unknown function (DUF4386)
MVATTNVLAPREAPGIDASAPLRSEARRAGLLYFIPGLTVPFALVHVPRAIFVSGDPTATANRIRDARGLVELGIAAELVNAALMVIALLALYRLFRRVSEPLAATMAALFLVSVPLQLANLLTYLAALTMTSGTPTLAAFSAEQLDALAYTFVRLHARGIELAQVFWGLWLIPYGIVVRRSGFIPAWLGIPLVVAGVAYVVASVTALFFPDYARVVSPVMLALGAGELPILVWLIGWGAKREWVPAG